jgi:hypothetical protein
MKNGSSAAFFIIFLFLHVAQTLFFRGNFLPIADINDKGNAKAGEGEEF